MNLNNKIGQSDARLPFRIRDLERFFIWLERRSGILSETQKNGGWILIFPDSERIAVGTTPSGAKATCRDRRIHKLAREFNVAKSIGKQKRNHSFALKTLEKKCLELGIYCAELEERLAVAQERIEILS